MNEPVKIDLDELERKAKAVITARAAAPKTPYGGRYTTDETANTTWDHSKAAGPPVTLALIARIRELEEAIDRTIGLLGNARLDDTEGLRAMLGDLIRALGSLVEKGAVLP